MCATTARVSASSSSDWPSTRPMQCACVLLKSRIELGSLERRPSCGHLDLERNQQAWASGTMVRSGPPAPPTRVKASSPNKSMFPLALKLSAPSSTLATMFFDHRACVLVLSQTSKLCMAQVVDALAQHRNCLGATTLSSRDARIWITSLQLKCGTGASVGGQALVPR